jgi:hypothetical protein
MAHLSFAFVVAELELALEVLVTSLDSRTRTAVMQPREPVDLCQAALKRLLFDQHPRSTAYIEI